MSERNIYHIKFMHQEPEGSTKTITVPSGQITNEEIYNGETVCVPTCRRSIKGSHDYELQEFEFLDLSKAFRIVQDSAEVAKGDNQ